MRTLAKRQKENKNSLYPDPHFIMLLKKRGNLVSPAVNKISGRLNKYVVVGKDKEEREQKKRERERGIP